MRHAFTQLQSASPSASLSPFFFEKLSYFGLRYPVIRDCAAPVSSQESTTQLLNNVYNAPQDWRLCVKTARRSACHRLCETGARCPLHKVL